MARQVGHEVNKYERVTQVDGYPLFIKYLHKLCEEGQLFEAFQNVDRIKKNGVPVSSDVLTPLLQGCMRKKDLERCRCLWSMFVESGVDWSIKLGCQLIHMFASCGCMPEALRVFSSLHEQNTHTWTAIISAHAQHGQCKKSITLYKQMQMSYIKPSSYTIVAVLKACACIAALDQGKLIHSDLRKRGLETNSCVGNTLIDMYSKCGSLENAIEVFDKLQVRTVVSWNVMISGYVQHWCHREALQLFQSMQKEGMERSKVTFLCILKVCTSMAALNHGKLIHADICKGGLEWDVFVGSALVDMYAKCDMIEDAHKVFDTMQVRNVVSGSSIISGYAKNGHGEEALKLFRKMQHEGIRPDNTMFVCILKACTTIGSLDQGKLIHADIIELGIESNVFVGSILVDMYAKCGDIENARKVFDRLRVRNVVSWSAMIEGYAEHGQGEETLKLFGKMQQEGTEPNGFTFVSLLKLCGGISALDRGKLIHADIMKQEVELDIFIGNALVDMYAKCGSLGDAFWVFDMLDVRNLVSWSAMIEGFANHGHYGLTQQFFERMVKEGIPPDGVTFVSLLSSCSHAGLVNDGHLYFKAMKEVYGVTPTVEHYACMVDLLGRAGLLNEAEDSVCKMPFQPDAVVWKVLLGSCAKYGNLEVGKRAFDCLIKSDASDAAGYVLMSNIYAANHMWEDVQRIQEVRVHSKA